MHAHTAPATQAHDAEVISHCVRKIAPYKGYTCIYAGFGALIFQGLRDSQVRVDASHEGADWLDEAWELAKAAIDRRVASGSATIQ